MKIFYDGTIFLQQWKGGINRIFEELAGRLSLLDKDVRLYLHRFPGSFNRMSIKREHFMLPKIGRLLREYDSLLLKHKIDGFKTDIYHTTYYRIPDNIKGAKVITVYDLIHEKFSGQFDKSADFIKTKRKCIEKADKIITISGSTRNDITEMYGVNPDKISVVYLAAGDAFKPAGDEIKLQIAEKYKLNKPFLLYVGQRGGYKNFKMLLKAYSAWENNKSYDLVCVGGRNWSLEEIETINLGGLANKVKLLSAMDDDELAALYSLASIFVYPSKYEGFGIPILEAMACGTPVIASNSSSIPEVAGNAAQYFEADSEESLMHAIEKVVSDAKLQKCMIENGFKRKADFSWDKTVRDTYGVYSKLL